MVKTYYRNEYTEKQWKALIDKAAELGCQVTYGRYGDRAEIDSTDRENAVLQSTDKSVDDCSSKLLGGAYPPNAAGEHRPQNVESAAQEIPQRLLPDYLQEPEVSGARAGASRENNRF